MKWIEYFGEPYLVLRDEDLARAAPLICEAAELWRCDYCNEGHIIMGAGVAVLYTYRPDAASLSTA